ncbi:YbdD/YjiX family protein [Pseudonocardia sp. HH130630-07]|uniref:YbdD/YjiX family protein n=1 Tax=Pseudonocardia sp. HH130630-07 TaxID=1690815 RepID=UPI0009F289C8|nr:YbdD/YjiX family protein [Pseudonocardia sp. HH130630-07]
MDGDRGRPGQAGALRPVLDGLRGLHRWWRGVIGADLYERYLDHHRRTGHDHPPMTEREYWRARTDHQERNPQGRCC